MSFIFPKHAREYFRPCDQRKDGGPKFDAMFDQYYLCLMLGLDARQIGEENHLESSKFVEKYPENYLNQADVIAGLLIDAELDRKAVEKDDRQSVEQEMLGLLDVQSPTRLSSEGNHLLNLYAAAGFDLLRDQIPQPQTVEDFLVAYHQLWNQKEEG
ncbi:hypothetical protein [Melittangium boletus]|uniref:hypothetical protein n=1 Tax=Melittangium boletus TaxID=83453 RepID=UPI003DA36875